MPRKPKPFLVRDNWYTDAGGKRTLLAQGKKNKAAAVRALDELLAKQKVLASYEQIDSEIRVLPLVDQFLDSLAERDASPQTVEFYRFQLLGLVREHGEKKAREITGKDLKFWLADKNRTAVTLNLRRRVVRSLYRWACTTKKFFPPMDPTESYSRRVEKRKRRLVTEDERIKILEHCKPNYRDLVTVMSWTTLRPKEACSMTFEMIDLERSTVRFSQHKTSGRTKKPVERLIWLAPAAMEVIKRRKEKQQTGLVFTSRKKRITVQTFSRTFSRVCAHAGIGPDANGENLTPYSLRRTMLTQAARAGLNASQLMLLGGWTGLEMAEYYIHLSEQDTINATKRALDEVLKKRTESERIAQEIRDKPDDKPKTDPA